jgi:hypothetical protein
MMNQFIVVTTKLNRYLTLVSTDEWTYAWGFHKVIKKLPCHIESTSSPK